MTDSIYSLRNLRHEYGRRCVLDIESMTIDRGEVLAVVGPSGAGKSTLLRLLNFLESPTQGDIDFDGHPATADLPLEQRRRVTTAFQRPLLLQRSVRANLRYALSLRGRRRDETVVNHWMNVLGIESLADQSAVKLSAGEAQRAALARALVVQPDVLLLDEPTANLDPYNVGVIESAIREVHAEQATTIVLVTHNVFQAKRVAQRSALLMDGGLVEIAPTDVFFEAPTKPETAAFTRGDTVY